MNIKKGDKIKILSGKDSGKTGKVLQVFSKEGRASIEGLNLAIKHLRPNRQGEKGQRIEFPASVNISNLTLLCPECGKGTRISHKIIETENSKKKYRACKKCQQNFD